MKIRVKDNLGKDVTNDREWYINTDGKIFYYTGDIDAPLYVVDNDYTWHVVEDYFIPYNDLLEKAQEYLKEFDFVKQYYDVCDKCSNNPKNGGSGICNCALPYMQNPIMYSTGDSCMANNIGGGVYFTANTDNLKKYKADADRIVEAVERTKPYIKEG